MAKDLFLSIQWNIWEYYLMSTSWNEQIYQIKLKLNHAIHVNLNTLRIAYYSLFQSHLQYDVQLWGQKDQEIKQIIQKLQNRALRKINFKKFHHSIKHIYKDHKILKFTDILKVQNCLFMYQVEQINALSLPSTPETKTITRPDLQRKTC